MQIVRDNYWHHTAVDLHGYSGKPNLFRDLAEMIPISLLIFFVVRALVPSYWVEGQSMLPTLQDQERVLVNKAIYFRYDANFVRHLVDPGVPADMHYLFHSPQRGDIVVFEAPVEARQNYIKRVIAVAGETVEIKRDNDAIGDPNRQCGGCGVYVNGIRLNEPYVKQTPNYDMPPTTVPEGRVFVLGDNRRNSEDSHIFGPLEIERIAGAAFGSFWPQDHLGLLPHPTYAEMEKQQP
jgi:signal peptidase I